MNYFLMMIIVGLCCGGYYGYTVLDQKLMGDESKLADAQAKLDPALEENAKLEADNAKLTKSETEAQTEIADLTQQIQTAQAAQSVPGQNQQNAGKSSASSASVTAVAGNNLGNISTLDGQSHLNCTLLKVQATSIVISDSTGITQMSYGVMPPDLQKRFGYDPHGATSLTDAQVELLEDQRKAAAPTAGN